MQVLLNFLDENNYDFDSDEVVFTVNEPTLKNMRPTGAIFYSGFNSGSINANWGAGTLTGSGNGGIATADSKLVVISAAPDPVKWVDYPAASNGALVATGTVDFLITPEYSGSPSNDQHYFAILGADPNQNNNMVDFQHLSSGQLQLKINDSAGAGIFAISFGAWSPVAGTEYRIQFHFDISAGTSGTAMLFINGTQFGTTATYSGGAVTRTAPDGFIRIGTDDAAVPTIHSNFRIDEISIYTTILNTEDYTVSTDQLSQTVYSIANPLILTKVALTADEITSFLSTNTVTEANDAISFVFQKNGTLTYHDGSTWVIATDGYGHSNTLAEVQANLTTLLNANDKVRIGFYLHSELGDGTGTPPKMTTITFVFNYADQTDALPSTCEVKIRTLTFGAVPIEGAFVKMIPLIPDTLDFLAHLDKNALISNNTYEDTTDENGRISINAIPSSKFLGGLTVRYRIEASKESIGYLATMLFDVPNLTETDLDIDPATLANQ